MDFKVKSLTSSLIRFEKPQKNVKKASERFTPAQIYFFKVSNETSD